jgi:acyl-CoA thioesterase
VTPDSTSSDSEFDLATALSGDGPVFTTALDDRWDALAGVNGGFMLALVTRALGRVMPFPDPLVVSGFFLRPGKPGPATISTEVIRAGKTTAFGQASLLLDGKEVLRVTGAFTDLEAAAARGGPVYDAGDMPALPPPDACAAVTAMVLPGITVAERFEYRAARLPHWAAGEQPSGNPGYELWMRFGDGREPDLASLPLIVDAAAPAVLEVGAVSTTVELTVHLRAKPAPGWLACRITTRHVSGGYHEEDFDVWDSTGKLVAQSRQLGLIVG